MKKGIKLFACALCAVFLFSCNGTVNNDDGGNSKVTKNLTEQIDDANGTIDFKGAKIAEDASVDDKVTIKNLDMDGKTLTVYTSGVVLENVKNATVIVADGDVTLKNCTNIIKLEVKKNPSETDDIVIDASQIETIEINKDGIRIVLKDKDTKVEEIIVSANDTTVEAEKEADKDAPVIETLTVTEEVDNVSISGGKIENLVVETSEETAEDDKPVVTLTGETEITKIEGDTTVYVTEEAKDAVKLPEETKTEEVTEKSYELYNIDSVKVDYTVGDTFDYTNLAVKVIYSNGSIKIIPLTKDNCEITGFNSSKAGNYTIEINYNDKFSCRYNITVRNPAITNGTARQYIDAALEILSGDSGMPDFDLALSYFKKAYESDKTDETKLYYALAELASISTDESLAKLLKENFGLKNYPTSMNALFSGSWMKEYISTKAFQTGIFVKDPEGEYIRGNNSSGIIDSSLYFRTEFTQYDEYWIYPDYYSSSRKIEPSNTGDTMFTVEYSSSVKYDEESGEYISSDSFGKQDYLDYLEENKDYRYSLVYRKVVQLPRSATGYYSDDKSLIPEFAVIDENDSYYQATLYNSLKTSETMSYLMLANFFNCNAEGFNKLIDNILNVYDNRFENAKALVSDLKQESITVPADIINALGLDEILGTSTVKIGKAEVDICFAAMDIYKGIFQWFSSYDLSLDLDVVKARMFHYYNPNENWGRAINRYAEFYAEYLRYSEFGSFLSELYNLTNEKTFTVRSESAMAASKNTILNALNKVIASYEYITGNSKTYPSEIKAKIKEAGDPVNAIVKEVANALKEGGVFEVKNAEGEITFAIDLGKFFKAGYFTNLIEKNAKGDIKYTLSEYTKAVMTEDNYLNGYITIQLEEELEIDIDNIGSEISKALEAEITALSEDEKLTIDRLGGYISIDYSKISGLFPGLMPETTLENSVLKIPVEMNRWWFTFTKPIDKLDANWFVADYDLSEILKTSGIEESDIVSVYVLNDKDMEYGYYNSRSAVYLGDVKTIKESGFVSYVTLNKNFTDTARTYLESSALPAGIAELKADDSVSAEKVKLFVYSNMSEPDPDLHFEFTVYRDPASSPFQYMDVQYYDSKNKLLRSGYSVPSINSTYTLTLTKVE